MGSNPSPNGRSPHQGESRHYRTEKNSENWFFENSRVKEGESLYNRRRAPVQEQEELLIKTRKEERRVEPVNPSSIQFYSIIYLLYLLCFREGVIVLFTVRYYNYYRFI
jgi:hypothetical protein